MLLALLVVIASGLWIWRLSGRWIEAGEQALRVYRFDDAEDAFQRAARIPLRGAAASMGLARAAWMSGDTAAAEKFLVDARHNGVSDSEIAKEQRLIEIRRGAAVELRPELPEMLRQTTNEEGPVILEAFVAGFLNRGQGGGAAEILALWEDAAADDPRLWFWRGIYLETEARTQEAVQAQRKAISLAPAMVVAQLAIAESFRQSEYYREAIPIYRRVFVEQPDDATARLGIAICQLHTADHEAGARQLESYLQEYTNNNEARLELAAYHQSRNDSEKVIATLAPINAIGEQEASSNYMNAVAYHRLGQRESFEKAFDLFQRFNRSSSQVQLWKRSYDLNPTGETARRIALAIMQVDQKVAGQWILKALSHQPADAELNRLMAEWLKELGQEDAAKLYEQRADAASVDN